MRYTTRMQYIFVYGAPATGKTTLAATVAAQLSLPLVRKDQFKELLFDTLGYGSREVSDAYGRAARAILADMLDQHLRSRAAAVYEAPFRLSDKPQLAQLCATHGARGIEIFCTAPPSVISERFFSRITDGNRHPGHHTIPTDPETLRTYLEQFKPLGLGPHVFTHDTTTFDAARTASLVTAVRELWRPTPDTVDFEPYTAFT